MTRCPEPVPQRLIPLQRHDDPYQCDGPMGHVGAHYGHAIGYSYRESDELGRSVVWETGHCPNCKTHTGQTTEYLEATDGRGNYGEFQSQTRCLECNVIINLDG